MALLKEAAAEGGSLRNLDCREGLSSGRAPKLDQDRSSLQLISLPLFFLQGAFGSKTLQEDEQSSKLSWKTRSSG